MTQEYASESEDRVHGKELAMASQSQGKQSKNNQAQEQQANLLPSLEQGNRFLSRHASALAVAGASSAEGEQMLREASKHQLAMKIQVVKTAIAMRQAGELQVHTAQVFGQMCDGIDGVVQAAADSGSTAYMERLAHHLKDQTAGHLADIYDECIRRLREEATRTVTPPPPQAQKRGFFGNLVGE